MKNRFIECDKIIDKIVDLMDKGYIFYRESELACDPRFWLDIAEYMKWDQPIWKCKNKDGKINKRCDSLLCEHAGYRSVSLLSERWFYIHVWGEEGLELDFWKDLLKTMKNK